MSSDLISLQEAAELIGKNLRTIQRHIKAGKLARHDKDGKSFVSRDEVAKKFGIKNQSPKIPVGELPNQTERVHKELDYEGKWIEEIQKHAETREELGIWKGRAEAYQAFASRLLGNGNKENAGNNVESDEKKTSVYPEGSRGVNKSVKTYTYIIYALIGVFFIIMTFSALILLGLI